MPDIRPAGKFIPGIYCTAFDPRFRVLAVVDDYGNLVPLPTKAGAASHYLGVVSQDYH